jgi:hypothetical protein
MVVKVKNCALCGADIPQGKTREQLMELKYKGCEMNGQRSKYYHNFVFCPKHDAEEVVDFIAVIQEKDDDDRRKEYEKLNAVEKMANWITLDKYD